MPPDLPDLPDSGAGSGGAEQGPGDGAGLVVLGLDPGSRRTGYGLVREVSGRLILVDAGVVSLSREADFCARLGCIFRELSALIAAHRPREVAVENVYVPAGSARGGTMSALKLGQARGAAIAACAAVGLPVASYEASVVKKSLTGVGGAGKEQVAFMVGRLLGESRPFAIDASDALAVAICHLNERRMARLLGKTAAAARGRR